MAILKRNNHEFHIAIWNRVNEIKIPEDCRILKDNACIRNAPGGGHNVPMVTSKQRTSKSVYTWVDLAIIVRNEVCVIVEIEESEIDARKVCGKIFATALCSYCIPVGEKPFKISDSVLFIQILRDRDDLSREERSYEKRWGHLCSQIRKILSDKSNECSISKYLLISGKLREFDEGKGDKLKEIIENQIKTAY